MKKSKALLLWAACGAAALALSGCGSDSGTSSVSANGSTARGTLTYNPPFRVAHVTAAELTAQLTNDPTGAGAQLLAIAGTPTCGIDVHRIEYATVGGAPGETATATGALMVPNGTGACGGARPIVLYAHGTTPVKTFDIANIVDTSNAGNPESALVAAMFAAQGYIVVAPNYAGYDTSSLPYHPYLNADQQSKDMIDALTAARSALGHIYASGTTDNGKLFITGYSEGGHVALATQRALQALGQTVTATAPMSGPYAMEAMGDAVITGNVNLGSTLFIPLIISSYQHSYGHVYTTPGDVYSATYLAGIDALVPGSMSYDALVTSGKLPQSALFQYPTPITGNGTLDAALARPANPLFAAGFGSPYLINDSVRIAYAADAAGNLDGFVPAQTTYGRAVNKPTYPLRDYLWQNDLRTASFVPTAPTLLCGGINDPSVFFFNAQAMLGYWTTQGVTSGLVTLLDIESNANFQALKAATAAAAVTAGATDGGALAVAKAYHGTLVPPFCTAAARGFFSNF